MVGLGALQRQVEVSRAEALLVFAKMTVSCLMMLCLMKPHLHRSRSRGEVSFVEVSFGGVSFGPERHWRHELFWLNQT